MHALSVVKALLLVAYLDDPRVCARALRAADHRLIDPMIRRSDNAAATRVLDYVGAARVRATAGRVGMRRFRLVTDPWGASRIDASDQTLLPALRGPCRRAPPGHRAAPAAHAVLTSGNPDRAYAQQTLRGVFARLLRGLAAQEVATPT